MVSFGYPNPFSFGELWIAPSFQPLVLIGYALHLHFSTSMVIFWLSKTLRAIPLSSKIQISLVFSDLRRTRPFLKCFGCLTLVSLHQRRQMIAIMHPEFQGRDRPCLLSVAWIELKGGILAHTLPFSTGRDYQPRPPAFYGRPIIVLNHRRHSV